MSNSLCNVILIVFIACNFQIYKINHLFIVVLEIVTWGGILIFGGLVTNLKLLAHFKFTRPPLIWFRFSVASVLIPNASLFGIHSDTFDSILFGGGLDTSSGFTPIVRNTLKNLGVGFLCLFKIFIAIGIYVQGYFLFSVLCLKNYRK